MKIKAHYRWGAAALLLVALISAFGLYQKQPDPNPQVSTAEDVRQTALPSTVLHQTVAASPKGSGLAALYRHQINKFALDFSTVIHVVEDQGEKIFMDANVLGEVHVGVVERNQQILAIAKILNADIYVSNGHQSLMDAEKIDQARDALAIPFGFEYNADGSLKNIRLASNEDTFTAGVKRAIASRLQMTTDRTRKNFQTQEVNETGRYLADYATEDFKTYSKRIQRYTELASVNGAKPAHSIEYQEFFGSYGLNQAGALEFLTATATVVTKADIVKFKADSEVAMQWLGKSDLALLPDMLSRHQAYAVHQMSLSTDGANKPQLAADQQMSSAEFAKRLADLNLDDHGDEIWNLRELFVRSIQSNPANLQGLEKLFANGLNEERKSLYLGALKDAGTPEAQAKLIDIISDEKIDMETRKHAMSHLNFIEQPTLGTLEYLENTLANGTIDPGLRATAILALGGVARAGLAAAQNAADGTALQRFGEAVTRLEQGYAGTADTYEKTAYLMGLGNAGHETSTPMLMQLTASDDAGTRALAVDSLRFHKGSAVDQKVISLMSGDQDIDVQVSAARSTVYRDENPEIDSALLQTAKNAKSEDVRLAALSSLDFRNEESEFVTREIQTISQSDASPKVREFAEQLYKGRTQQDNVSSPEPEDVTAALEGTEPPANPHAEFSITNNQGTEAGSAHALEVPSP